MVDKEGTEAEVEAMKAYRAARVETEDANEADTDEVSSALIDRVKLLCSLKQLNQASPEGSRKAKRK